MTTQMDREPQVPPAPPTKVRSLASSLRQLYIYHSSLGLASLVGSQPTLPFSGRARPSGVSCSKFHVQLRIGRAAPRAVTARASRGDPIRWRRHVHNSSQLLRLHFYSEIKLTILGLSGTKFKNFSCTNLV